LFSPRERARQKEFIVPDTPKGGDQIGMQEMMSKLLNLFEKMNERFEADEEL